MTLLQFQDELRDWLLKQKDRAMQSVDSANERGREKEACEYLGKAIMCADVITRLEFLDRK